MPAAHSQSHPVANRDVNPSDHLVNAYPALACLVRNEAVSAAFASYERTALRWKKIYVFFGRLSLVAVFAAMVSFDYQITLKAIYGAPPFLSGFAAVFAGTGLFSQAMLALTRAKERWLAARFAAERLRCFKFELFTVLEGIGEGQDLALQVRQRTEEGLAALELELMGGWTAILQFSPFNVLSPTRKRNTHPDKKLLEDAAAVYDIMRFGVEEQHLDEYFRKHDRATKMPSLLSEFSFLSGAVLACIGILTTLLPVNGGLYHILTEHGVMEWLDFLTWMLFVLSAVVAIYERGSAHQPNAERYVTYGREIRRIRGGATAHMPTSFFEAVREMEHLMLREIQDFCRDVKHSNYIF